MSELTAIKGSKKHQISVSGFCKHNKFDNPIDFISGKWPIGVSGLLSRLNALSDKETKIFVVENVNTNCGPSH